jgi:hypothetical protein
MKELTKDQEQFLDRLLSKHPGCCVYKADHNPRVHEVAAPLVDAGWVDRFDDELADDEAVIEAFGEGMVAYRFSDALVGQFRRTAAEKAKRAGLH